MKDYPWDYIGWILENSSQCGIGGGHGGEEDYISSIVFCFPMLENFAGLGFCCLFICFIEYDNPPLCIDCNHYIFILFSFHYRIFWCFSYAINKELCSDCNLYIWGNED